MMLVLDHLPLKYGLHAEIVAAEEDRPPYVPPKVEDPKPPAPHIVGCPCTACEIRRARSTLEPAGLFR
jgi:hypothetical protein